MKRMLAAMILAPAIAGAQNLVTNATMEETSKAAFRPRIEKAEGWSNGNAGTADLFVHRDRASLDGIPDNFMGTQDCEGANYAGIIAYFGDERLSITKSYSAGELTEEIGYGRYTEYLQGEFSEPLKAGKVYNFSFQVSLAEQSDRAIRGLGAYISTEKMSAKTNSFLKLQPQVISEEVIADMDGWTEISGTFVAHGGERYVTIGAFPQYLTVMNIAEVNENDSRKAYYYIARPKMMEMKSPKPEPVTQLATAAQEIRILGSAFGLVLNFPTGSAELRPGDAEKLEAVARYMIEYPETDIRIEGHTDVVGSAETNRVLSAHRAYAVRNYLVGKGVARSQIETEALGETKPLEELAYESPKNRRITLYRVE